MRVIGDLSRLNAIRYPDKPALIMNDVALSYRELDARSNQLAHALLALGLKTDDRVALLSYNRLDYGIVTQAVAKCGAWLVPMNFRFVANEIRYILENSDPAFLIMEPGFTDAVTTALAGATLKPAIILLTDDEAPAAHATLNRLTAGRPAEPPEVVVDPFKPCVIMYTSGTTGFPKGVLVSHETYFRMYVATAIEARLAHQEVFLIAVPMFHAAGMNMALHQSMFLGATGIIHRGSFDPPVIMQLIERHHITLAILVPMTVSLLAHHPDRKHFDLVSLNKIFYGSAPMTPDILADAFQAFPQVRFTQFYGSTESGMIGVLRSEDHERWSQTTGHQALLSDSRIVDDAGRQVGIGAIGEVIVSQRSMGMIDYWRNPTASRDTIRDGWIYTGDLARVEGEGFFTVIDRRSGVIITGGENVYPKEVENVIAAHPAVREVAVFGLPDPLYGETVCAVLGLWPDKAVTAVEIDALCREQLAAYKRPRRIEFLPALPRNTSDKIQKHLLRDLFVTTRTAADGGRA